jgi:hypothetical protein
MKKIILFTLFLSVVSNAFSQQNLGIVSGGYSFAKVKDTDVKVSGWRINGTYEFNPYNQKWSYGLSAGYLKLRGSTADRDYDISSIPVYFAPKYTTGNNKLKGFVKLGFGIQLSDMEMTGTSSVLSDHDYGFVGGGGAGFMYLFSEKFFLTAEYEIMWLSNSFYSDGWLNTISGGLGMKF